MNIATQLKGYLQGKWIKVGVIIIFSICCFQKGFEF